MNKALGVKEKKRIGYIDGLRGFTMLLVVFGHVLTHGLNDYSESSPVYCFFQSFRMPMFFFVSGYIAYKATELWDFEMYTKMLKKKAVVQLVPTFIFFILHGVVFSSNLYDNFKKDGVGIYWFCQALFEMFFIYYTVQVFCKYTSPKLFVVLIVLLSVATKVLSIAWDTDSAIFRMALMYRILPYFMYFTLGLLCKKYNENFLRMMGKESFMTILLLSFFLLFLLKYHHDFAGGEFLNTISERLVLRVVGLLCVFSFFYNHASFFEDNNMLSRVVQFVGRRTLDIYLIHYFFIPDLSALKSFFEDGAQPLLELIFGLTTAGIIILISLVCSYVIRQSSTLGYYLLGVKKKQ